MTNYSIKNLNMGFPRFFVVLKFSVWYSEALLFVDFRVAYGDRHGDEFAHFPVIRLSCLVLLKTSNGTPLTFQLRVVMSGASLLKMLLVILSKLYMRWFMSCSSVLHLELDASFPIKSQLWSVLFFHTRVFSSQDFGNTSRTVVCWKSLRERRQQLKILSWISALIHLEVVERNPTFH